jgi:hypothetical protein
MPAWYPPDPGKRFPEGNVPLKVLQIVNTELARKSTMQAGSSQVILSVDPPSGAQDSSNAASPDSHSKGNSEDHAAGALAVNPNSAEPSLNSDLPLEWSPTPSPPKRRIEQLPPDSSADYQVPVSTATHKKTEENDQRPEPTVEMQDLNIPSSPPIMDDTFADLELCLPRGLNTSISDNHISRSIEEHETVTASSRGPQQPNNTRTISNNAQKRTLSRSPSSNASSLKKRRLVSEFDFSQRPGVNFTQRLATDREAFFQTVPSSQETRAPSAGHSQHSLLHDAGKDKDTGVGSAFEDFTAAYNVYTGNKPAFLQICNRIFSLRNSLHKWLWDDFAVRFSLDYPEYAAECERKNKKPLPYEDYYREHVDEPIHTKRIITPAVLDAIVKDVPGNFQLPNQKRGPSDPILVKSTQEAEPESDLTQDPDVPTQIDNVVRTPRSAKVKEPRTARSVTTQGENEEASKKVYSNQQKPREKEAAGEVEIVHERNTRARQGSGKSTPKSRNSSRNQSVEQPQSEAKGKQKQKEQTVPLSRKSSTDPSRKPLNHRVASIQQQSNESTRESRTPTPTREQDPMRTSATPSAEFGDPHVPLKTFIRNFVNLKSVGGSLGKVEDGVIVPPKLREKVDVLAWRLSDSDE